MVPLVFKNHIEIVLTYVRFEILTVVTAEMAVFWDDTPYSLADKT
jgi:hypothetical protein